MPNPTDEDQARATHRRLLELFGTLKSIMDREGEDNWVRGVAAIVSMLEGVHSTDCHSITATVGKIRSVYRGMHGGIGSFADYYIRRDDSDERLVANKELDAIRDEIWAVLKC